MKKVESFFIKLCSIMNGFSAVSIFAMMLLVVANTVLGKVFARPIVGATEVIQMLIVLEMASLAMSIIAGRQICVSALFEHFPPKMQLVVDIITCLLTIGVCGITAYAQFVQVGYAYTKGTGYHFIGVPYWPFVLLFGISFAFGTIGVIMVIVRKIRALVTGNYEGEIMYTEKKRLAMEAAKAEKVEAEAAADAPEKEEGDSQ